MPYKSKKEARLNRLKHRKSRLARRRKSGYDKLYGKKRLAERQMLIKEIKDKFGGKCQLCGYNKNYAALLLHHIDEGTKKFNIAKANSSINKYADNTIEEASKCVLMCFNCHQEVHHPKHKKGV